VLFKAFMQVCKTKQMLLLMQVIIQRNQIKPKQSGR
jgi:hypothetical protein